MPGQPFHRADLGTVLLDHAERTLREGGVQDLSLRELARLAGVSHGAPRSHFIDRQALLDAMAERGFNRLADTATAAIAGQPADFDRGLRAVAAAYVGFAVSDAALLELMFAAKNAAPPKTVQVASERLFGVFGRLIDSGVAAGRIQGATSERTKLLFAATMQGIASLIGSKRISPEQGEDLIDDALGLMVAPATPRPIGS